MGIGAAVWSRCSDPDALLHATRGVEGAVLLLVAMREAALERGGACLDRGSEVAAGIWYRRLHVIETCLRVRYLDVMLLHGELERAVGGDPSDEVDVWDLDALCRRVDWLARRRHEEVGDGDGDGDGDDGLRGIGGTAGARE